MDYDTSEFIPEVISREIPRIGGSLPGRFLESARHFPGDSSNTYSGRFSPLKKFLPGRFSPSPGRFSLFSRGILTFFPGDSSPGDSSNGPGDSSPGDSSPGDSSGASRLPSHGAHQKHARQLYGSSSVLHSCGSLANSVSRLPSHGAHQETRSTFGPGALPCKS